MPCEDIGEIIEVELDADDRLRGYGLTKESCGAEVGRASLLGDLLRGQPAATLARLQGDELMERWGAPHEGERFLLVKHLLALREALAVYLGERHGGPDAPCALIGVEADDARTRVVARIRVELLAGEIRACSRRCSRGDEAPCG